MCLIIILIFYHDSNINYKKDLLIYIKVMEVPSKLEM